MIPGDPDLPRRALYAVQQHGYFLCHLVRSLLLGLHGVHTCSLCQSSNLVQSAPTFVDQQSLSAVPQFVVSGALTLAAHRKNSIVLVSERNLLAGLDTCPGTGDVTAVIAGGVCPGVECDECVRGRGWRGLPLLAAGVWPPRDAALYTSAPEGVWLPPPIASHQRKLVFCHSCQVSGAGPSLTERWRCFQALFLGLPGLLLVLMILQVCVATATAVFSCKAIIRHRSSAHLEVSHTPESSSCIWLCWTFCPRLHTRVNENDKSRLIFDLQVESGDKNPLLPDSEDLEIPRAAPLVQ